MAGYTYNSKRYYTRSQQLSEQRDDINTILRLKAEVRELQAERDLWRRGAIHLIQIEECSTTTCEACAEVFEAYEKEVKND